MLKQFKRFNITNYEFIEAIEGKTLDKNEMKKK